MLPDLASGYGGEICSIQRRERATVVPGSVVRTLPCDLRSEEWLPALDEADHVVWLAALRDHGAPTTTIFEHNIGPLRSAIRRLQSSTRLRRFVFMSSISALDQPPPPAPIRIIDDFVDAHPMTPYGYSKLVSESLLQESGLPHTVLRLPFLYGPNFARGSFLDFYRRAATSGLLGSIRYPGNLSLLYTGDVAGIVLALLDAEAAPAADRGPFVLSDGRVYEVDELITLVAHALGHRRRSRTDPPRGFVDAGSYIIRRLTSREPRARGRLSLTATYWVHAAFTRNFFVVDPTRFHSEFPDLPYTDVACGLRACFPVASRATSRS